ncbi:uncharacterized protein K02A2.6-like [Frankliniella occidentalis]|uniref:RNA-directed DNA polymerase n=1 Tax=Frankliniella occidentalis TaxID=133901 RepID=A0A9C6U5F9_FRAOC|nr:uncharacterized protein K02A2.6-like [Frankliniella occidentalis]
MGDAIQPLTPGDDLEHQWKVMKWRFHGFVEFDNIRSKWSAEKRAEALMHIIGLECQYLYANATEEQRKDVKLLTALIDVNIKPRTNHSFERFRFHQMTRNQNEDINQFIARLESKIDGCGLPETKEEFKKMLIMDSIIHNLHDQSLQQVLFTIKNEELKLAKVIDSITVCEAGQSQLKEIQVCRSRVDLEFVVADVESVPLLGLESCEEFGLINRQTRPKPLNVKNVFKISISSSKTSIVKAFNETYASLYFSYADRYKSIDEIIANNPDVFNSKAGCFPGKFTLDINQKLKPVAIPSRRVPQKIREKYKQFLHDLCVQKIIANTSNPVGWISPVVLLEKANGSLRLCLDPKYLNEALGRPFYQIPSHEEINASLSNKRLCTVMDFSSGFWHCKLDSKSSNLCQFSTPFGVYKFLRLPFGLKPSPEIFQKAACDIFGEIDGVLIYFDDILIAANSEEEHDAIFQKVIERARQYNVHFNPTKLQYKLNSVKFLGHVYSQEGRSPDPSRVTAIEKLENPKNVKELQRFLGIVNYVREFVPNLADDTAFLRQLLRKCVEWMWLPDHSEAVKRIKEKVCNATALCNFDPEKPIVIQCDASQFGLGSCLMQDNKPVAYASRSLTTTEQNYAQIEKELLAIVFSCQKFQYYLYGHPNVKILTDHKPLVSIFKQALSSITSKRITRLMLKTVAYNLDVTYLPGSKKYIADALSRDYLPHTSSDEVKMLQVHMVTCKKYRDSIYLEATNNDKILQEVIGYVKTEWPIKIKISPEAQQYWWCRNFLAFENSLLFFKDRLVIPHELRTRALQELHVGHQGIVKCKTLASQTIYWPGITKDVEKFVSECCVCARSAPSLRKQPLMPHPIPDLPYQNIAVDILDFNGKYFLVTVDCYSKWLDVNSLSSTKSSSVNNVLEHLFSVHGIPEVIYSDNVPFNSKEFQQFLQMYNCQNLTCSPHHHQSNGLAEKATPLPSIGLSPAQMLMSRNLRSFVPIKANLLKPFVNPNIKDKLKAKQDTMTELYNKKAKRKSHEFQVGDLVYAQNVVTMYWEPAIILEICDKPRSCVVKIGRSEVRRNSRHIKPRLMSEPVITVPNTLPYVIANQLVSNSVNVPNPDPIVETQPRRSTREKKSVERLNL